MRLIDLILQVWSYRQELQSQWEKSLPSSRLNTDFLANLPIDGKRKRRMIDDPAVVKKAGLDESEVGHEHEPYTLDAIDPTQAYARDADGQPIIEQQGVSPEGGQRHRGAEMWDWLVARLQRSGIDLAEEDEYDALGTCPCPRVAELAATMRFIRATDGADAPTEITEDWSREIDQRHDQEQLAVEVAADMVRLFGWKVEQAPAQVRRIEEEVLPPGVVPATVVPDAEAVPLKTRVVRGVMILFALLLIAAGYPGSPHVRLLSGRYKCSGTCIGQDAAGNWHILTCGHTHKAGDRIDVKAGTQWVAGVVTAADQKRDLADVVFAPPLDRFPSMKLGGEVPEVDAEVTIVGWGKDVLASKKTKVIRIEENGWIKIEAATRPGDSGGALVRDGKLVGVHIRGDKHDGWSVNINEINDFYAENKVWKKAK